MFQVSGFIQLVRGESNSYAFISFSFFSWGSPWFPAIMTSLQQESKEEPGVSLRKQYFRLRDLLTRLTILRER